MDRKVTVAKSAGFCFGVERAVDQVYEQIDSSASAASVDSSASAASVDSSASLSTMRKWSGICRIRGSWSWRQRMS